MQISIFIMGIPNLFNADIEKLFKFILRHRETLEELSIRQLPFKETHHELLKEILSSDKLKLVEFEIEKIIHSKDIVKAIQAKKSWTRLRVNDVVSAEEREFIDKIMQANQSKNFLALKFIN